MCSRSRLSLLAVVTAVLLTAAPAAAYIDPGTAGLVVGGVGSIIVWILGAVAFIRVGLFRILKWGRNRFSPGPGGGAAAAAVVVVAIALGVGGWLWFNEDETAAEERAPTLALDGKASERVFLLGIDGLDPDVLQSLVDADLMPNFKAFIDAGSFHPFDIPNPAESPVVWASLATGKNPGQHGVFDFIGRDPESYLPRLALNAHKGHDEYTYPIRSQAWWDVTSEHNVPTTVLRWPMTFPPETVKGNVLPGLGVPDVRGNLGRHTYFTDVTPAADDPAKSKVRVVKVQDGLVTAALEGPTEAGLTGNTTLEIPFTVRTGDDGKSAVIEVQGQRFALRKGEWTDFAELTFESSLFKKYRGLVRFHLESVREPFALYMTPVQLHPSDPVVAFTQPPGYGAELREKIGLYYTLGMPEDTTAFSDGHLTEEAFFNMCDQVDAQRRKMLLYELGRFERGALAFVFDTGDRIQHMTPWAPDWSVTPIGRYLIEFDKFFGTVLAKLPENTPVIIFSDHGFSTFRRAVDLNRWLVQNGYMVLDEAAYKKREPGTNGELYSYVDWSKTRAYAVGFAGIFLNQEDREAKGTVTTEERAALIAEIRGKLATLKDPEGGADVVHATYSGEELYPGTHRDEAPDIVLGFNEGYRGAWQSAVGGVTDDVISDNDKKWQRDHIVDAELVQGTFITNFPLASDRPHAYDLAPTVLSLLGLPVPKDMEGRPLNERTLVAQTENASDEVTQ